METVKEVGKLLLLALNMVLVLYLLYFAVFCMPTLAGWLFLLAAVLVLPVKRVQGLLDIVLPRKPLKIAVLTVAVLALAVAGLLEISRMQTNYEMTGELNRVWGYYIAYYLARLRDLVFGS